MEGLQSAFALTGMLRTGWQPRDEVERPHHFSGEGWLWEFDEKGNQYELRPEGPHLFKAAPTRSLPFEMELLENDAAADWLVKLDGKRGVGPIKDVIRLQVPMFLSHYFSAEPAERVLAAGQLLAAKCGLDGGVETPPAAEAYLKTLRRPKADLLEMAEAGVRRVVEKSELRDLWEDSDHFEAWKAQAEGLADRLRQAREG